MDAVFDTEMEIEESTESIYDLENVVSTETVYSETVLDSSKTDVVNDDNTVPVAFLFVFGIIAGLLVFNQLSKGWKL